MIQLPTPPTTYRILQINIIFHVQISHTGFPWPKHRQNFGCAMSIKNYLIASQCRFLGFERNLFRKILSLLWTRTNHIISCHGTFHSNILFVGLNSFANKNSLCKSFDENTVCCFGVIMILHKGIKLLIPLYWAGFKQYNIHYANNTPCVLFPLTWHPSGCSIKISSFKSPCIKVVSHQIVRILSPSLLPNQGQL